jgi:hypothetical protein
MKIKCARYPCQICSKLASIQVFYSKSGDIKYTRARHYIGTLNGKPQFMYHPQNIDVLKTLLKTQSISLTTEKATDGQVGQAKHNDLLKPEKCLNQQNSGGCRLAWSRLVDLGSIDSGSNPGSPTKFFRSKMQNLKSLVHRRIIKGII